MKNYVLIMLAIICLTGCSNDDDTNYKKEPTFILKSKEIEIKSSDSIRISVENMSSSDITFKSNDSNIVSVSSDGKAYAKLIGKTYIVASNEIDSDSCLITVTPKIITAEPFYTFGATKESMKEYMNPFLIKDTYSMSERKDYFDESIDVIGYYRSRYTNNNQFNGYHYVTRYYFKDDKLLKTEIDFEGSSSTDPYNGYLFLNQTYYLETISELNESKYTYITYTNKEKNINIVVRSRKMPDKNQYWAEYAIYTPR